MLKYLIVQLDDSSTSFCHYESLTNSSNLMPLETLKAGILWAMKENLVVQFVYPDYELPKNYLAEIETVDHIDIKAYDLNSDVIICNGITTVSDEIIQSGKSIVLRLSIDEFFKNINKIARIPIVNIIIKDIDELSVEQQQEYEGSLHILSQAILERVKQAIPTHLNILTDRLQLTSMNNCNAGIESIALCPDGLFYICPAFYFSKMGNSGNPIDGIAIQNQQLFKLDYAPICRKCDAFHCKRCVWLNVKNTLEVNTPSHEQCVASHIERNASKELLENMRELGIKTPNITIPKIDYLDPFETF